MKRIKLAIAIVGLSMSTNAYAMPDQIPDRWYDQMWSVFSIKVGLKPCGPQGSWCF
jgi:hypothetical protein